MREISIKFYNKIKTLLGFEVVTNLEVSLGPNKWEMLPFAPHMWPEEHDTSFIKTVPIELVCSIDGTPEG